MARIRTIKPDFFKHSGLYDLEIATGLPVRLAFAGLWTCADREGRFKWHPRELKLDCLPYDECNFADVLDALASGGFVKRYVSDGKAYGYIPSWKEHQLINKREAKSSIPSPEETGDSCQYQTLNTATHVQDTATHVHARGEGKGRERKGLNTPPLRVREAELAQPEDPDAGAELTLASALFDELAVPSDFGTRTVAADAIRQYAKETGSIAKAFEEILAAGMDAKSRGETVNRFWFTDQRYLPKQAAQEGGTNGTDQRSAAHARVSANKRALVEAFARRGGDAPDGDAGADGGSLPAPRPCRQPGGLSVGLRAVGDALLTHRSSGSSGGVAHYAGGEILPATG